LVGGEVEMVEAGRRGWYMGKVKMVWIDDKYIT
jgi:hypothetical protein